MPIVNLRIPLGDAALTAAGCTQPEYAVDEDGESGATFGPPSVIADVWQPVTNPSPQPGQSHSSPFAVVPGSASPRFLKADWGDDRFITQIRIKGSGDGLANAGVSLLSAFGFIEQGRTGEPPEIPLLLPPLPNEDGFLTVAFDPPYLSSGVVFHPDALLSAAELAELAPGDYPTLLLSQLDVFEAVEEGNLVMPLPTKKRSRAGVQEVLIYPHNDGDGPFDGTTVCQLFGLGSLGIGATPKVANVTGGETVHPIDGFETERSTKIKVASAKCDLRTMFVLLGGTYAVDAASGSLGEVQYWAEKHDDRLPFFRLKAKSTVGNGTDSFVYFKCKVSGSVSYNLDKDKVTELDFEFEIYFDETAQLQDGSVGGTREWLYGSKGEVTRHS